MRSESVTWIVPDDVEPGQYKIRHTGYFKRSPKGSIESFTSTTPVFEVKK